MWKNKVPIYILLLIVMVSEAPARMANQFSFFQKNVGRRYQSGEFDFHISQKKELNYHYRKIEPYFFSYRSSPFFQNVMVRLSQGGIYTEDGVVLKNQNMIFVKYERRNFQRGALEVYTRSQLPSWVKAVSLWIYNYKSDNEAYFYIKEDGKVRRYFIGKLSHKGWRNFVVPVEVGPASEKIELEKIKFFNRKAAGGANGHHPVIQISRIEIFSKVPEKKPDLSEPVFEYPARDFLWELQNQMNDGSSLRIASSRPVYYRLENGQFWSGERTLSFQVEIQKPVSVEIYGSLLRKRNLFFILQSPFLEKPGKYWLHFRFPPELAQYYEDLKAAGVIFWGFGVVPLEPSNPNFIFRKAVLWPSGN